MSIISKMRKQKAIYWAPTGNDGYGDDGFQAPVEIQCRWQDVKDLIKTATGEEQISNSLVFPDRVVVEDGYLKLGELSTSTLLNPREDDAAFPVLHFEQIPNLKNTETLYKARL